MIPIQVRYESLATLKSLPESPYVNLKHAELKPKFFFEIINLS